MPGFGWELTHLNDYHVHSHLCRHGEGKISEYVAAAVIQGMTEIGFAEHIPLPQIDDPDGRMHWSDFPLYYKEIEAAQKAFPEITIRIGLEADFFPEYVDYLSRFIADYPFDYIIGSIHFLGDWNFDHPKYVGRYHDYGIDSVYRDYYYLLRQAAGCGLFDIIGHFDLPKKYGYLPTIDLTDEIEMSLLEIHNNGLALDVNTSGLRKPSGEIYPSASILRRAKELDIPIVLGSDAHNPQEVGWHFQEVIALLREIGYTKIHSFEKRQRFCLDL